MVTDPSGESGGSTDTKVVVITATDVDEVPSVKAADGTTAPETAHMVDENANLLDEEDLDNSIYDSFMYLAVATDDEDTVSLLLNGDDAAAFKLVDRDGAAGTATVHGLTFKEAPNYEKPTDANKDNAYKVKVVARDDAGHRSETSVTVVVTNVNEDGSVMLSSIQPAVGTPLTATVTDPDGEVTNVIYQWTSGPTEGQRGRRGHRRRHVGHLHADGGRPGGRGRHRGHRQLPAGDGVLQRPAGTR